jgi:hypothetical protein
MVVPAHAGTHTPRPRFWHSGERLLLQQATVVMGPRFRGDDIGLETVSSRRVRGFVSRTTNSPDGRHSIRMVPRWSKAWRAALVMSSASILPSNLQV